MCHPCLYKRQSTATVIMSSPADAYLSPLCFNDESIVLLSFFLHLIFLFDARGHTSRNNNETFEAYTFFFLLKSFFFFKFFFVWT